ncbi:MAG: prolyl oligopeptidase family serine peptidase [Pirellulaceae bacterium]|nr:prolyl oligopeptidase family serine peptidase [Pirellulaceae bacterium]
MKSYRWSIWAVFALLFALAFSMTSKAAMPTAGDDELTLEQLFGEKRPLAAANVRTAKFSPDSRYVAYLYRPNDERRHGTDLYLYDFSSVDRQGEAVRVTTPERMALFQRSTRETLEDRKEAAKKRETQKDDDKEEIKKDADRTDAPRYSGISDFLWSPESDELLFASEGDLYRLTVSDQKIDRLTRSQDNEQLVSYLPDGSGFLYFQSGGLGGRNFFTSQSGRLFKYRFGESYVEQVDTPLSTEESLSEVALSPDGKRLAFLTAEVVENDEVGRTVEFMQFGDRFSKTRQVNRTMADDIQRTQIFRVYLYQPNESIEENDKIDEVFSVTSNMPRDRISELDWSPDSEKVTFAYFDQNSSQVTIYLAEMKEGKDDKKEEKNKAKVAHKFLHVAGPDTPGLIHPKFLADSRHIGMLSEQSGYRQLYKLDPLYEQFEQVTRGSYEVYPQRISDDRKLTLVTATKENPWREEVYTVNNATGKMSQLNLEPGHYTGVAISNDGQKMVGTLNTFGQLAQFVAVDNKTSVVLADDHPQEARDLVTEKPTYFSYENRHGHEIHGHYFLPDDWSANKKYPLLIYVYGGPLTKGKETTDGSYRTNSYGFARYMAKKHGYVTCTIDPRGMSGFAGVFEKANYKQIGRPQVEDLVDGVAYLIENQGVDAKRVAIHGWSFGGFQTQMCMYTAPETFTVGIAGAGPTEWENYNSWYTTGNVGPSQKGKTDQKQFSLVPLAKNLKGRLLLVHGMADSNVLYQDTVHVYQALLKAGKEDLVDLFLDPTGGHGLGGDVQSLGKYRKYEAFLLDTIGSGKE